VKKIQFNDVKVQEASRRMEALRRAKRSSSVALALQRRASLVDGGDKWRITNFRQVAGAMAKWA